MRRGASPFVRDCPYCALFDKSLAKRKLDSRRVENDRTIPYNTCLYGPLATRVMNDKLLVRIQDQIMRYRGDTKISRELGGRIDVAGRRRQDLDQIHARNTSGHGLVSRLS
jgi:hypothetical protein